MQESKSPKENPSTQSNPKGIYLAYLSASFLSIFYIISVIFLFLVEIPFAKSSVKVMGETSHYFERPRFITGHRRADVKMVGITICSTYTVKGTSYNYCEKSSVREDNFDDWKLTYFRKAMPVELLVDSRKPWIAGATSEENNLSEIFLIFISGYFCSGTLVCGAPLVQGKNLKLLFRFILGNQLLVCALSVCFILLVSNNKDAFAAGLIGFIFALSCIPLWMYQKRLLLNSFPKES